MKPESFFGEASIHPLGVVGRLGIGPLDRDREQSAENTLGLENHSSRTRIMGALRIKRANVRQCSDDARPIIATPTGFIGLDLPNPVTIANRQRCDQHHPASTC